MVSPIIKALAKFYPRQYNVVIKYYEVLTAIQLSGLNTFEPTAILPVIRVPNLLASFISVIN